MLNRIIARRRVPGLQQRLTFFSLFFALVPLVILGITSASSAGTILRNQLGSNLQGFADAAKLDTQRFLESRLGDIQVVAQSPILTSATSTRDQKTDFLRTVQKAYGIYGALYVTDTDGIVIASTDQTGGDQSRQPWFQNARQGKVSATDVYFLTSVQNIVITFSAPIQDSSGTIIGVVGGHVDSRDLFGVLTDRTIGQTGEIFLVNGEGRIIGERERSVIFNDVSDLAAVKEGIAGHSGVTVDTDNETSEQAMYAYEPLSGIENWIVIAKLPLAEVNEPINALGVRTALIALVTMVLVSIGIFVLSRNIINPIRQLTGVAENLSQGNYNTEVPAQTTDELGQLAGSFKRMATAIQERDTTLTLRNSELEEANRLKDVFLATMSHELRTPLNAIIGFSGIMSITGKLDDTNVQMVNRIRANSERLLALINDILEISRIESGRLVLVRDHITIRDLVTKLEAQLSVLADIKKIELVTHVDDNVPAIFVADEDALTKIIVNLASNAIKFTSEGKVELNLSAPGNQLKITVSDTGIGIPAHMHDLIFESFRQADSSTTRAYGGSGLGLSIVRQLCGVMNGAIHVQSEVGKGSTFTVELPLEVAQA